MTTRDALALAKRLASVSPASAPATATPAHLALAKPARTPRASRVPQPPRQPLSLAEAEAITVALDSAEDAYQAAAMTYAEAYGWLWCHIPASYYKAAGTKGAPDCFLVHEESGRVLTLEFKRQAGTHRPDQGRWGRALQRGPVRYYVVRPSDWPTLKEVLAMRK